MIYAEPDYDSLMWRKVSKEGLDFVQSFLLKFILELLVKDQDKRITLKEILQHSWIKNATKPLPAKANNPLTSKS